MAITSYGYPGTVDAVAWSKLSDELGEKYGVVDTADLAPSVVVGPDRTIAIAAGTCFGRGVLDVNSAPVNIQLDVGTGSAGALRYDTIVARRTWGATNATTLVKINGTSSPVVSASRVANPGTQDDQPLALIKITTGSTVPVIEADLRTWPSKAVSAKDLRALADPTFGDLAYVNGLVYRRILDGNNNPVWDTESSWKTYTPTWTSVNGGTNIASGTLRGQYRIVAAHTCHLKLWLQFASDTNGGVGEWKFGYPAGIVPDLSSITEMWGFAKCWVPKGAGQLPAAVWFQSGGIVVYSSWLANDSRQFIVRNTANGNSGPDSVPGDPGPPADYAWSTGANLTVDGTFPI